MASSLNMELKTFLVVLRKVSSGELAVRSAEGSAFPSTCAVPVRQARPPFSHGRGPAREACPLFPRGPGARHHEGECRVRAGTSAREQAAHGSVPSSAPDTRTSGCPRVL